MTTDTATRLRHAIDAWHRIGSPARAAQLNAVIESLCGEIDALRAEVETLRAPLTDEQIDAVTMAQWGPGAMPAAHRAYARAIERAHGIGQEGGAA